MEITQSILTDEIKTEIYAGFREYALEKTGFDGLENDPVSFEGNIDGKTVGRVVVQIFWGQLHIKYLLVNRKYRSQRIGTQLMQKAFRFGGENGCTFAFVETLNFQACEFYQKLGFKIDFIRDGYAKDGALCYLTKKL